MDSLDLSSSPPMAATREGDSSAEDVGVLSAVASLRKDAAALYQLRKYAECVDVLNQLLQKKEDDPKILQNIALAEFFQDGCSNPKKLVEALLSVKKKYEDLAHGSREEMYAASWPGNKSVSAPKGTSTGPHKISSSTKASIVHTDKFDSSLPVLNMAIVFFYLHEYPKALSVLEPLFQNIEPIDEGTALHVCLLLLDVALATQNVPKFAIFSFIDESLWMQLVYD